MKKLIVLIAVLMISGVAIISLTNKGREAEDGGYLTQIGSLWPTEAVENPVIEEVIRLWVVGDFGDPLGPAQKVAEMAEGLDPDAVITVGDNNYPTGAMSDFERNTHAHYGRWIDSRNFFPALGNHDWGYPASNSYSAEDLPHSQYFSYLPGNRRYYSVVMGQGLVEIFIIDSDVREPDGRDVGSVQYLWAEEAITSSEARVQLVAFHEPAVSTCARSSETKAMDWPFKTWGADMVFTGHCHGYERLEVGGLPYLVNGFGGGGGLYGFEGGDERSVVRYDSGFGGVLVEITQEKMKVTTHSLNDGVIDEFTVTP